MSFPLPSYIAAKKELGQQLAELYALKKAFLVALMLEIHKPLLIGDSVSAMRTGLKLSCPASQPARAKLLRQIVRVSHYKQFSGQLAFIPSEFNPSDCLTKPLDYPPSHALSLALFARMQPCVMSLDPHTWPMHKHHLAEMGWIH